MCIRWSVFCSSVLYEWGWCQVALTDFVLGGALELYVKIFRVKNLGLTFGGCTWQWWLYSHFLVECIVWRLDLIQDENLGSDHAG
jgi:hypothetical protein